MLGRAHYRVQADPGPRHPDGDSPEVLHHLREGLRLVFGAKMRDVLRTVLRDRGGEAVHHQPCEGVRQVREVLGRAEGEVLGRAEAGVQERAAGEVLGRAGGGVPRGAEGEVLGRAGHPH